MKKLFLSLLLVVPISIFAQLNSVVYLKNGSEIRGEVVKNDSSIVRIRTKDGSYWNFSQSEILGIEKYQTEIKEKGYYNKVSLGALAGAQLSGSMRIVNGYAFNKHNSMGLGIGIESLRWNPYLPIFFEYQHNFLNGNVRPFVAVHAGYLMPLVNMEFNSGGFSAGVEIGVEHHISRHASFYTSLGYRYAYLRETSFWWDDFVTITHLSRAEIRLGFVFR